MNQAARIVLPTNPSRDGLDWSFRGLPSDAWNWSLVLMTLHRLPCLIAALLAASGVGQAADWEPSAGAPLLTPWAKDVSPTNVLPEYPRPLMQREAWQNLNGLWDYAITGKADERPPESWGGKILVPFCVESALSGVMRPLKPDQRLWYRRTFTVPKEWSGQRVLLHFGAVDWHATVFLDGRELGGHRGGYDAFTFDITGAVKSGEAQELVVSVWDPTDASWQLRGKQSLRPGGAAYTACSGIWQTVWLEPVPAAAVESLRAVPDLAAGVVKLTVDARTPVGATSVVVTVSEAGKPVATASGTLGSELTPGVRENLAWYRARRIWVTTEIRVPIPNARPWTPGSPVLYDLTVQLGAADGTALDTVRGYVAMRDVAVGKDDRGTPRLRLNGEPVMLPGALDQGYWPDGIYTAPTDAALRSDVEAAKKLGLLAVRKHLKIEPERYYYWADRLGLLVLQDLPSGSQGDPYTDQPRSPEAASQCESEMQALIRQRWNHPSIVMWNLFNEGWGQSDTLRHAAWAKQLDPGRLVNEASGFPRHGGGDVHDTHGGDAPPDGRRVCLDSETAGFGLAAPGHSWPGVPWATGTYDPGTDGECAAKRLYPVNEASKRWFTRRLCAFYDEMWRKRETTGTSGDFKVQLYDVETESNGFLSYDRVVWKVDPDAVRSAASPPLAVGQSDPPPFTYSEGQSAPRSEVRDPCIVRDGDVYYLVFTMWPFRNREEKRLREPDQGGSPGIALYSSRDLKSWRFENWLVRSSDLPDNCPYKNRFWAPEIHKFGGKFYLIFTADNWLKKEFNPAGTWGSAGYAFVGVADAIGGPYRHITYIPGAACDTSIFEDTDGKTYAVMPRGHIDVQEIDLSRLSDGAVRLLGTPRRVLSVENTDIGVAARPDYLEGPWVEKVGARYCLFYAANYTDKKFPDWAGYWTGVAYTDSPLGPWTKDPRGRVFLGGHLAVFDGPGGRKWVSYRDESDTPARGRLRTAPVAIDPSRRIIIKE